MTKVPRGSGVASGLLAGALFGVMAFLVRHSRGSVPSAELVFLRALLGLVLFAPLVRGHFRSAFGPGSRTLWIRAVMGTVAMCAFYWNLQHTSVGTAKAFMMLAPVLLALASSPILGEAVGGREKAAIALAVAGASALYLPKGASPSLAVTTAGIGGAACTCVGLLSLRRAAAKYPSAVVVWCFSLICAVGALLAAGPDWVIPSGNTAVIALAVALTGVLGQIFMTRAFRCLRAPVASGLIISSIVWGVGFEILFEGVRPSLVEFLAYALVLGGVLLLRATAQPLPVRPRRTMPLS